MRRLLRWGGFGRDQRGGIAIMAAVFGMIFCAIAALAIDLGSVVLTKRQVQGVADLAAMSAARDLPKAQPAATATANANLPQMTQIKVQKGHYTPDAKLKPHERFRVQSTEINAAQVEITAPARLYFSRYFVGSDHWNVTRKATAALPQTKPMVMFSIGSRLASLNGGLVNQLLSGLLGTNVSVDLVSYNNLANVDVNLLQFSNALATKVGVTAGDYDALLKHEVAAGDVLKVLELVAGSKNSALSTIAGVPLGAKIKVSDLIGVEAEAMEGLADHLNAKVSAMDLLMATLQTANGKRQLDLDLGLQAGLATVRAYVAIGERPNKSPWLTITNKGSPIISTAQARLYLEVRTAGEIKELGQVNLPLLVEVASAQAKLDSIQCQAPVGTRLLVKTGLAKVSIGEIDKSKLKDFTSPLTPTDANLVYALGGLVRVTAKAHVDVGDENWSGLSFSRAEIDQHKVKSVRSTKFMSGAVNSLIANLKLKLHVGSLGLVLSLLLDPILDVVLTLVANLLAPLGGVLDALLQPLLGVLGLKLGEADVVVHGLNCGQAAAPRLVA